MMNIIRQPLAEGKSEAAGFLGEKQLSYKPISYREKLCDRNAGKEELEN
jgi:hypothetical protein